MEESPGSAQVLRQEPLILLKGEAGKEGEEVCMVGRIEEDSSRRGQVREAMADLALGWAPAV